MKEEKNINLIKVIELLNRINFFEVILILYFKNVTNSYMLGMSILSLTTIFTAIFEIPTGILSDKIGRKETIILGIIFSIFSNIALFLSKNYLILLIYALLKGIENALFSGNNDAYVYDNLKEMKKEDEFTEIIGKVKSMTYLAAAISAVSGAILVFFYSYKVVIAISIIPKVIELFISFLLGNTKKFEMEKESLIIRITKPIKEVLKNDLLRKKIFADGLINSISEACFQFRIAFYELVWPTWALGIPNILANFGAFISNWFGGKVTKKYGYQKVYIFNSMYDAVTNIFGVLIKNVFSPLIIISNSLFQTDFIDANIEQKLYKDEIRASMGSVKSFAQSIIFSILSIILGLIADKFSIISAFIIFQTIRILPSIVVGEIINKLEKK